MKKQRRRLKAVQIKVSNVIESIADRKAKRKEHFNTFMLPIAKKHHSNGKDWETAKKFAQAEHNLFSSQMSVLLSN
jgi:hypothetical protein